MIEEYTLKMTHEIVDEKGKKHLVDEPIKISTVINGIDCANINYINYIINQMLDRMRAEILK